MDIDQFIWSVGVKMDRPVHLGKRVASWATGMLDSDEYDRWYCILEFDGKEMPVYLDSSIRECSECYIPNLLDFMEKVQAVLIHAGDDYTDTMIADYAEEALGDLYEEFMDLDIHAAIEKEKANAAQRA